MLSLNLIQNLTIFFLLVKGLVSMSFLCTFAFSFYFKLIKLWKRLKTTAGHSILLRIL